MNLKIYTQGIGVGSMPVAGTHNFAFNLACSMNLLTVSPKTELIVKL